MKTIKTAVVCPVFNEPRTWKTICRKLTDLFDLVVVVDDGSDIPIVRGDLNVVLLRNTQNQGKGRALSRGLQHCLNAGADAIATIDSDGEHDPRSFESALHQFANYDMLNLSREAIFADYSRARRLRNQMISRHISAELGIDIKDTQSGMRIYSAAALRAALSFELPSGYAIETIMLRQVCQAGFRIRECPMTHPGIQRPEKRLYNPRAVLSDFAVFIPAMLPRIAMFSSQTRPISKTVHLPVRKGLQK